MYTRPHKTFITNKIKKICFDYKKAVDLRNDGGGRILIAFYGPFQDIWAESPVTTILSDGFDSSMVSENSIVRNDKETYHIDYIVSYIAIRNQQKSSYFKEKEQKLTQVLDCFELLFCMRTGRFRLYS